jgi:hypothetical protein
MRRLVCLTLVILLSLTLVSCANQKSGDIVGDMTVEVHTSDRSIASLDEYCGQYYIFGNEPGAQTFDCEVPFISKTRIYFGWNGKDTTVLDTNLSAMTWEFYIDEHQINLDDLESSHRSGKDIAGNPVKALVWDLDLVNISPGKHTFRLLWKSDVPIDDGYNVHAPGTYENIVNFTVLEK